MFRAEHSLDRNFYTSNAHPSSRQFIALEPVHSMQKLFKNALGVEFESFNELFRCRNRSAATQKNLFKTALRAQKELI